MIRLRNLYLDWSHKNGHQMQYNIISFNNQVTLNVREWVLSVYRKYVGKHCIAVEM